MKRQIALTLALALTSSLLACAGGSGVASETAEAPEDTTTAAPEPTRLDELGAKDFEGREFVILDANDHPDMHVNIPGDALTGDIVNDSLYNRDAFVSEQYNIEIKYEQMVMGDKGRLAMKNSVLSDDDSYQLIITPLLGSGSLSTLATEGILANLSASEYLSLDKSWWSALMYDSLRLNDKMYYTTGDIAPSMYQMAACMFINTKLCDDYGIEKDFVELVREGKWTLDEHYDTFKDFNEDLNDDGKMHASDDFFGMIHLKANASVDALTASAGIEFSTVSADGKSLSLELDTEKNVDLIEKIKRSMVDINFVEQNDIINVAFKEDRALTLVHSLESALVLRDMNSDYMIVPMPKADEAQESYISPANAWCDAFIAIPTTADLDFVGFITEALAYYSYANVRPFAFEMTYGTKIARNDDWNEMINIVYDTQYLDFNLVYNFGGSKTAVVNALLGNSLSTQVAGVQSATETAIEKFVESWG